VCCFVGHIRWGFVCVYAFVVLCWKTLILIRYLVVLVIGVVLTLAGFLLFVCGFGCFSCVIDGVELVWACYCGVLLLSWCVGCG